MDEITYVKRPREYYACQVRKIKEYPHFYDVQVKDLCILLPNNKRIYADRYTDMLVHDPIIDKYCLIASIKFETMFTMRMEYYVNGQLESHESGWH